MACLPDTRSRLAAALRVLSTQESSHLTALERSVTGPFPVQDAAAILLGKVLWIGPLLEYRAYAERLERRPHLWRFPFSESGRWNSDRWSELSLNARIVRARLGALDRARAFFWSPEAVSMPARTFEEGVGELQRANLAERSTKLQCVATAIATPAELNTDLRIVEIIAHWLRMLAKADEISRDRSPNAYDVHGYSAACPLCRERWGQRDRSSAAIPPFHPGCRCYAQPRFTL